MENRNLPIKLAVTRLWNDGKYRIQTGVRHKWFQFAVIAALAAVILRNDFSFQFSIGKQPGGKNQYGASLIPTPFESSEIGNATRSATSKKKKNESKEKKEPVAKEKNTTIKAAKKTSNNLNLANEATAVGAALSEDEKKTAEGLSNLAFILNPGYAAKHNISEDIVKAKLRKCFDYIKQYKKVAKEQADSYNIPVSVTLAQGLLESNVGDSRLSQKANNHFGIKCFSRTCGSGHCMNATDDSHKDFFRIFKSGDDSFRSRSEFLQKDRYKHLTKLKTYQYKEWAYGLQKAGYATDPKYAKKIIAIIERLHLYAYDK